MGKRSGEKWVHLGGAKARCLSDVLPRGEWEGKTHLVLSRRLIDAGRNDRGRFSDRQLAALGVPLPPRPGWLEDLIGLPVRVSAYAEFLLDGRPAEVKAVPPAPGPAKPAPDPVAVAEEIRDAMEKLGAVALTEKQKRAAARYAEDGDVKGLRGLVKNVAHTLSLPKPPPGPPVKRRRRL